MYKLALLVVMFMVVVPSIGCQPQEMSEEELRNIVREEVAIQLTGRLVQDVVKEEITSHLVKIGSTVQEEVDKQLARQQAQDITSVVEQEVMRQLAHIDTLTLKELYIRDKEGQCVIMLGASADLGASIIIEGASGRPVASLSGADNRGMLYLYNSYGEIVAGIGAYYTDDGGLGINDKYGEFTFIAP